jgi:hypothetical protein
MAVVLGVLGMHVIAGDVGKGEVGPGLAPVAFRAGQVELEGGAGFLGSFSTTSSRRVTINYQMEDMRLGWMFNDPEGPGWLRGTSEALLEVFGGPVTKGPGSYLAGGSLLWRYNFVQPGARIVPYLQLGAGASDNDIYHGHGQREIGEAFEFVLQGDLGVRYLINDQWAVSAEMDYRHISNADLASRNEGLNSVGGLMELSYFFK